MVVRIDLMINKQTESYGPDKFRSAGFVMLALFILASALFFLKGIWRSHELDGEKKAVELQLEKNAEKTALIDAEFKRIEAQNAEASRKLDFVLSGAPVIEFLYELGKRMPDGVVIESLDMSNMSAALKGVAFSDEDVLELGEALSYAAGVASVLAPAIKGGQRLGIPLREFSMELKLSPLLEILAERGQGTGKAVNNGNEHSQNEAD